MGVPAEDVDGHDGPADRKRGAIDGALIASLAPVVGVRTRAEAELRGG